MTRLSARPLSELDKATRARLEVLLGMEPSHLTDGDKNFLNARKDYLTAEQRKDFGIKGKVAAVEIEDDVEDEEVDETEDADEVEEDEEEVEDEPAPKPKKTAKGKGKGKK